MHIKLLIANVLFKKPKASIQQMSTTFLFKDRASRTDANFGIPKAGRFDFSNGTHVSWHFSILFGHVGRVVCAHPHLQHNRNQFRKKNCRKNVVVRKIGSFFSWSLLCETYTLFFALWGFETWKRIARPKWPLPAPRIASHRTTQSFEQKAVWSRAARLQELPSSAC